MIFKTLLTKYAFSERLTEDIDVDNVEFLRHIEFEFNGTLTAVGGTTDATLIEDGLLFTLFDDLFLTADGSDRFVNTNARNEYFRRAVVSGSEGVLNSVIPTGAATTNQRVHVVLDMDTLATAAKFAGRLNVRRFSNLTLRTRSGTAATDLVTGGDRTYTLAGDIEVYAVYDDGNRGDPLGWKGGGKRIAANTLSISASNDRAELVIPSGLSIPRILFVARDNSVRDNDILIDLKIRLGERDILREVTWEEMQSNNVERYGLELVSNLPPYTGIAVLDFDLDGDMNPAKLLNTIGLRANAAKAILNVGSPTGVSLVDMIVYGVDPRGVGRRG